MTTGVSGDKAVVPPVLHRPVWEMSSLRHVRLPSGAALSAPPGALVPAGEVALETAPAPSRLADGDAGAVDRSTDAEEVETTPTGVRSPTASRPVVTTCPELPLGASPRPHRAGARSVLGIRCAAEDQPFGR